MLELTLLYSIMKNRRPCTYRERLDKSEVPLGLVPFLALSADTQNMLRYFLMNLLIIQPSTSSWTSSLVPRGKVVFVLSRVTKSAILLPVSDRPDDSKV